MHLTNLNTALRAVKCLLFLQLLLFFNNSTIKRNTELNGIGYRKANAIQFSNS